MDLASFSYENLVEDLNEIKNKNFDCLKSRENFLLGLKQSIGAVGGGGGGGGYYFGSLTTIHFLMFFFAKVLIVFLLKKYTGCKFSFMRLIKKTYLFFKK